MVSTISRYMPMRGKVRCCIVRPPMRVSLRRAIHPWNQAYHELFRANPKINFSTVVDCSYRYAGSEIPYGIARGTDDRGCSAWLGLSTYKLRSINTLWGLYEWKEKLQIFFVCNLLARTKMLVWYLISPPIRVLWECSLSELSSQKGSWIGDQHLFQNRIHETQMFNSATVPRARHAKSLYCSYHLRSAVLPYVPHTLCYCPHIRFIHNVLSN